MTEARVISKLKRNLQIFFNESNNKTCILARSCKAIGYSLDELRAAYASEAAFRQEVILLAIGTPLAFLLHVSPIECAIMIGSLFLVLII